MQADTNPDAVKTPNAADYWSGFRQRVITQLEIGSNHPVPEVLHGVLESIEKEAAAQRELLRLKKCAKCKGRGWYLERFSDSHRTQCSDCGGTGRHD